MRTYFYSPVRFGAVIGFAIALLALPVFSYLGAYQKIGIPDEYLLVASLLWLGLIPPLSALGLQVIFHLPLPYTIKHQFVRYGMIGVFNTFLNLALFNTLLFVFGVVSGPLIPIFSAVVSAVVITVSFFINKFFVFDTERNSKTHIEYGTFFTLTSIIALLNVGVISFLINYIGAPSTIDPKLWANIAVVVTVPISVFGNFLGYKFFVFKERTQ